MNASSCDRTIQIETDEDNGQVAAAAESAPPPQEPTTEEDDDLSRRRRRRLCNRRRQPSHLQSADVITKRKLPEQQLRKQKLFQVLEDFLVSTTTAATYATAAAAKELESIIGKVTETTERRGQCVKRGLTADRSPISPSSSEQSETDKTAGFKEKLFGKISVTSFKQIANDQKNSSFKTMSDEQTDRLMMINGKRAKRRRILEKKEAAADVADNLLSSSPKKHGVVMRNEQICRICERPGNVIRCDGGCLGMFHASCLSTAESRTRCPECTTGRHCCFACKSCEGDMTRCVVSLCRKFYHRSCLSSYRTARFDAKGRLTCPLHSCLSCILAGDNKRAHRGQMCRCIRCPVAYHDSCAAAGSTVLSNLVVVCPLHYGDSSTKQINVNWCFICSLGGSLICCETCPASFHAKCLNIEPPEGSYFCVECQLNVQPKHGDIVWAKMGRYRWWPAKVCSPKNIPLNIQNTVHQPGEFPVLFFGTHDYYWTRRSRVFQFLEGDHSTYRHATDRLSKTFNKALTEALVAFQKKKSAKENREAQNHVKSSLKLPKYKHITVNRPVDKTLAVADASQQVTICDCDPNAESPCGSDSECLNRLLLIECDPSTCPAADRCQNQRFSKMQYARAEVFRTEWKGWGLRSLEPIKKGQFVNEYVGEIIDEDECRRRMRKMQEENDTSYYFLTLDKDRIIDAGKKGNLSRFMNHSCQPNCELHKWTVNADICGGLFALCDIPVGTELTFNYNLDCLGQEKTVCHCGAPNCSRFIGERPKTTSTTVSLSRKRPVCKQRRKRSGRIEHDNECFQCGLDGQLLLCDRKNCTKAYHLECLGIKKIPQCMQIEKGKWDCPWHRCADCGKAASVMCSACPTSFCNRHDLVTRVRRLSDGTVLCHGHTADQFFSLQKADDAAARTSHDKTQSFASTLTDHNCNSPTATVLKEGGGHPALQDEAEGGAAAVGQQRRRGAASTTRKTFKSQVERRRKLTNDGRSSDAAAAAATPQRKENHKRPSPVAHAKKQVLRIKLVPKAKSRRRKPANKNGLCKRPAKLIERVDQPQTAS